MPISFSVAAEVPSDAAVLAVAVFSDRETVDGAPVELNMGFLEARSFAGKVGETLPVMADDGTTVLAVGMGSASDVDLDRIRRAASAAVKAASGATTLALALLDAAAGTVDVEEAAQALAEGVVLGSYQFSAYKSDAKPCSVESVVVLGGGPEADVQAGLDRGAAIGRAVCLARDLVNTPARDMTPRVLEEVARAVADEHGLELTVWDEVRLAEERMGGLLGVAAGSEEPPRLLQLTYDPPGATATVVIVGKGITFDSGGLSLKTGEGMMTMKCDMGGAAAVLAAMSVVPVLSPGVKVVALAACTENMPSGTATRPGDVLTIRNGKTVEVLNTDAEGRLVLADALSIAAEMQPDAIIDLATLTGACIVALGRDIAGIMGNDDVLLDQVRAASERAGEELWPLPLPSRYRKHIDSEVADLKNMGAAGQAGTLAAGLFLQEFVDGVPWAHLDIAGPAFASEVDGYVPKGGTGFGVRTLVELISGYSDSVPTA